MTDELRIQALQAALDQANMMLIEQRESIQLALEALIWTTGSGDFSEGGQARIGALKLLFPAIEALREMLGSEE